MKNPTPATLIRAAWLEISEEPNLRDLWLCDETIHRRIRSLNPSLKVSRPQIIRALKSVAKSHSEFNILGLFHVSFTTNCPYSTKSRMVHYFYRHVNVAPSFPRFPSDVEDIFAKSCSVVEERAISAISARDSSKITINDDIEDGEFKNNPPGLEKSNTERANRGEDIVATSSRLIDQREISTEESPKIAINGDIDDGESKNNPAGLEMSTEGLSNTAAAESVEVNPERGATDPVAKSLMTDPILDQNSKNKETLLKIRNRDIAPLDSAITHTAMTPCLVTTDTNQESSVTTPVIVTPVDVSDNRHNIYWQSPEARKLFGFDAGHDVNVVDGLEERIRLLQKVNSSENGYQLVLPIGAEIGTNYVSSHNKFTIRQKSLFLVKAYQIALEEMKVGVRWRDHICHKAVVALNNYGCKAATHAEVVAKWNRHFRVNDKFPHPDPNVRMGKKHKPILFEIFPNLEARVHEFVMSRLDCLCVEMVREVVIKDMIPDLMKELEADNETGTVAYDLLTEYVTHPPTYNMVLRWMHAMGFTYSMKAKSYMVDGHEHPEQKAHRTKFTTEYLTTLEIRCFRWIQMSVTEFDNLPERDKIINKGYTYMGINGFPMVELHVDDHECLQKYANEKYGEFGGNTSVRNTLKPVIILGQDESIYNQFSFGSKQWVGKNGERAFLPKSDGAGVMISAFQSREFGWGLKLTPEQLREINEKRKTDGVYFDKIASQDVLGTTKKGDLKESPFIRKLWYGANNEGYWTGNHMIVQLEDCIDCLDVMYGDEYDFVFMFDHSSGHAKRRNNGLDVEKNNVKQGGVLQHPTLIETEDYLGKFHDVNNPRMVRVGQFQKLIWKNVDLGPGDGPIYMTKEERLKHRDDVWIPIPFPRGKTAHEPKPLTRAILIDAILKEDVRFAALLGGRSMLEKKSLKELQKDATNMGIEITKITTHRKKPSYVGEGKGMIQILHERGYVDENRINEYFKIAKDKVTKKENREYSLLTMLKNQPDFANEVSQLEYVATSLGARVIITTKYHAEYAGEGIEYSWGYSKSIYRRHPLAAKKGRVNFIKLVDKCISRDTITTNMVRKFSKRARFYMVGYKVLEKELLTNDKSPEQLSHAMIEKMKKIVSSHRAALDFDKGYLTKVITEEGYDLVSEVKSEKLGLVKRVTKQKAGVRQKRRYQTILAYKVEKKKRKE